MNRLAQVAEAAADYGRSLTAEQIAADAAEHQAAPEERQSAIVVALPAITTNLPRGDNDDPEPLHCTIRYFGDPDPEALPSLTELLEHLAETCAPFTATVSGRGRLGDQDAAVLFIESDDVQDFHDLLDGAMPGGEPDKFPHFIPHVTLAYGDDIDLEALPAGEIPESIVFDRIGLWNGDEHMELPLTGDEPFADADSEEKSLLLAAVFDAEVGAVVAGGVSVPAVDATEDLPAAIAYAADHPEVRWYVEERSAALAAAWALPWELDPLAAGAEADGEFGGFSEADVEAACEVMHDAYEAAAAGTGWETNPESRKPWAEVPKANQDTMRAAVLALFTWLDEQGDDDEEPDDDPDDEVPLAGPGGVQAAAALYVHRRSAGAPVEDGLFDGMLADAAAMGMLTDPLVLSAVAWHDEPDGPS